MPNRRPHDHIGNFNWRVEMDGKHVGTFQVLETASEEIHKNARAVPAVGLLLPAVQPAIGRRSKVVTLKKGYATTPDLQQWWTAVTRKMATRRDVTIIGGDRTGRRQVKLSLRSAIPTRMIFRNRGRSSAMEQVTINFVQIQVRLNHGDYHWPSPATDKALESFPIGVFEGAGRNR